MIFFCSDALMNQQLPHADWETNGILEMGASILGAQAEEIPFRKAIL